MIVTFLPLWGQALAAFVIAVLGVGRFTRLIVHEDLPPVVWLRVNWDEAVTGSWNKLLHCHWCLSVWVSAVCIGWFVVGIWVWWIALVWWIVWGLLALAYVAAMVIERDEPGD
jgi:hypothetical protein